MIDHRGSITYAALDRNSSALAKGLRSLGLSAGQHIGVLCFNHRDFLEASIAAAKAGLPCVYLNTGFAAPQLGESGKLGALRRKRLLGSKAHRGQQGCSEPVDRGDSCFEAVHPSRRHDRRLAPNNRRLRLTRVAWM